MKRILSIIFAAVFLAFVGCEAIVQNESEDEFSRVSENESGATESVGSSGESTIPDESSYSEASFPDENTSDVSQSESQPEIESSQPEDEHSELYIPDVSVEDVILWFNEVVLDAEFVTGGDASVVQKWDSPIHYFIEGEATEKDIEVLEDFAGRLNEIEGFPGFLKAENAITADLNIFFCPFSEFESHINVDMGYADGAVQFWYTNNVIYNATICYRNDIEQFTRNSVILEEIYNGLGPAQDTNLRTDSIIYSGYSEPQELTEADWLILKLLYHPDIKCGMNAQQCEEIIRKLYY